MAAMTSVAAAHGGGGLQQRGGHHAAAAGAQPRDTAPRPRELGGVEPRLQDSVENSFQEKLSVQVLFFYINFCLSLSLAAYLSISFAFSIFLLLICSDTLLSYLFLFYLISACISFSLAQNRCYACSFLSLTLSLFLSHFLSHTHTQTHFLYLSIYIF